MTDRRQQLDEVGRLTGLLVEGALAADDRRRLETLLLADDALLDYYQDYLDVHCLLHWQHGLENSGQWPVASGRRVVSGEWRVASVAEYPESTDSRIPESPEINLQISKSPNLQIPARHSPLTTLHYWAISYSVATVLLAVALLGAWSYTITHPDPDSLAIKNSRRVTPSGGTADKTSDFTFVGRVSGMVDCQWADDATATYAGAGVALNRRYALKSGLMELTYDSGAKVILQGPCEYKVESARGGFLQMGKLVARVGAGGGGRGTGTSLPSPFGRGVGGEGFGRGVGGEGFGTHSQPALTLTPSQRERELKTNPSPLSPLPSPLFTVHTPTALVEDLGTEFGVEVAATGETASHVFQGKVVMKVEGAGDGGRGTGDESANPESPNPRIPNPEIILSAGQSARVDKDKTSGELKLVSGDRAALSAQEKFVLDIPRPERLLDLLDVVAGGNGWTSRREHGIDATSGAVDFEFAERRREGEGKYLPVAWSKLIDGVFIPNGASGAVQLDSAGHVFDAFPETSNLTYGSLWSRAAELDDSQMPNQRKHWIYLIGRCRELTPDNRGLLSFCPNVGITFDLEAIRSRNVSLRPARLKAVLGMGDVRPYYPSAGNLADFWVFIDGRLAFKRAKLSPQDGAVKIDVAIGRDDRFLTLVSTNAEGSRSCDWVVLGDPVLPMISVKTEDRKEEQ
jgi:hypothetical protein